MLHLTNNAIYLLQWKVTGTAGLVGRVLMNAATHRNTGTEVVSIRMVTILAMLTVRLLALEMIQTRQTASMDVVLVSTYMTSHQQSYHTIHLEVVI